MRASTGGVVCAALLALSGCATNPEEDPVQIKLAELDARVTRIERVVSNNSLLELSNQLESMRADVRALHNDIDELNHSVDTSRKQQRDLYADLDQRLKALESRGGSAGAVAAPAGPGTPSASGSTNIPPAMTDTAAYQTAFAQLKDSQYDQAIAGFQQFLITYPDSSLADNAQYWLGEAYYVNKSFNEALTAFQRVVSKYPQSRKVPDALLKVGYCQYELKQWQAAKDVLSQVASTYSDTSAGHLAQQRLDKLASEKH